MSRVFDTSILINLERKESKTIAKIESFQGEPFKSYTTFLNVFEFLVGIKNRSPKNRENAIKFLNQFEVLHTTDETPKIMADIKSKYDKLGKILSIQDLIIASLTIENNMILITADKDFEKIDELKKEIL